ncbi:MAG: hypothetical protein ACOYVF_02950, partial [Candidatus Zixiibacteriota bacterium]
MKFKLLLICVLLTGLFACGQSDDNTPRTETIPEIPKPSGPTEITVSTGDSLQLTARFTPSPDSGKAPLLVMLP